MSGPPRRRPRPSLIALALASAALVVPAALAREYLTRGFRARITRPQSVAVLPPHAEFIKAKAVMTDEMVKEAETLEDEAEKAIADGLEKKGYRVRVVSLADLEAAPGLRDLVTSLNNRYDEEWSKVVREPGDVEDGRFTAGEAAAKVAAVLKVDGLVVARVVAVGVTGGKAALTAILSLGNVVAQSYARMDLSVLHGRSGRFEGHLIGLKYTSLGKLIERPAFTMGKLAEKTLHRLPKAGEAEELSDEESAAAAKEAEPPAADEGAIGDFEAILQKRGAAPPDGATGEGAAAPASSPSPSASPAPSAGAAPSPSP
jgi:hypothetical protein